MTVCIAAIYGGKSIVGASDRLLTAGDVQFEPSTSKIRPLTNSIVAMTSGDAFLSAEILARVKEDVAYEIDLNPENWLDVKYVVDRYCDHWAELQRRKGEREILKPLGLTVDAFVYNQTAMGEQAVQNITNALIGTKLPYSACLIAGVDKTGPHIWVIHDGGATLADAVGFAAIGGGARHAEFQLMLAQYNPDVDVTDAVALVHLAKSRAEVAPGVGADTDMFVVGPSLGTYSPITGVILTYLKDQASQMRDREKIALSDARAGLAQFLDDLFRPAEGQEADPDSKDDEGDPDGPEPVE
jgi:20S proteasome alpha/beta subunit